MENKITRESQMDMALSRARSENKPVLLDFFNPGWIGCQQMDTVSYPDKKIIEFINNSLISLRVRYDAQPMATDFNLKWTPTLIILDKEGKEHHRTVGFIPAEELIPSLLLGIAKVHFDLNEFKDALSRLEKILSDFPKSGSAPEAIYLKGVCLYKDTKNPKGLKEAYEQLQAKYPEGEWTKRA